MINIIFIMTIIGFSLEQPPDSPVAIIAQSLNNGSTNQNDNTTMLIGILDKYHNSSDPSFLYIVQIELKTSRVDEPFAEIEKRLDKLVDMAFVLAAYKHRKQVPPPEIQTTDAGYRTKIIKKRTSGDVTLIHFVTYAGDELVLGEVVADDLTLLSVSQMSAILRHPLGKIISDRDIEAESSTKWFYLVGFIGAGVLIILIGWCCLFLFYNSCGYKYGTDKEDFMTRAQRAKKRKAWVINPSPSMCEPVVVDLNDTLPSDGSNPSVTASRKPRLNKKMQRSCRTLSEIHLERRIENVQDNIFKAMNEAFNKAVEENKKAALVPLPSSFGPRRAVDTENTDVETAQRSASTAVVVPATTKSEKKRRHTKIGPITAVTTTTTTTTNEQEGKTSEISGVSSVTTTSTNHLDEFDVSNLPETTLKISKKKKNQNEAVVESDPESDYGSSLEDEKSKDGEKNMKEIHEELRVRPMTAKKQRTSLFGATTIASLPPQPRAWTVYQAGDRVAEFWNNSRILSHPSPGSPTENGIIQVKSSNYF